MNKEYMCHHCFRPLVKRKPIRLVIQKYQIKPYKQYRHYKHLDLCPECYTEFIKWFKGGS